MPAYKFEALDAAGKSTTGLLEADNARAARAQLRAQALVPLDVDGVLTAISKTGRVVVADPAHQTCSVASEISALAAEHVFASLKAPIRRVTTPDTQIPFSPALEKQLYPNRTRIADAVRASVGVPTPSNGEVVSR